MSGRRSNAHRPVGVRGWHYVTGTDHLVPGRGGISDVTIGHAGTSTTKQGGANAWQVAGSRPAFEQSEQEVSAEDAWKIPVQVSRKPQRPACSARPAPALRRGQLAA